MSAFNVLAVKVDWQSKTTMWAIKTMCHAWCPNQEPFLFRWAARSNRSPRQRLWWSEKAPKGTKAVKSKESPPAFWMEKEVIKRPWLQRTHRQTPRHHIQTVYPESRPGVRCQGNDSIHRYASSVVIAAYVDKAKISLASSGTAANFALAAQGTVWTANSHWEAGEAPGRACWSSAMLPSTPLVVPRLAGGKLT